MQASHVVRIELALAFYTANFDVVRKTTACQAWTINYLDYLCFITNT